MEKETPSNWLYVAPQRIRAGRLALPRCEKWADLEDLNIQRLARVFEFHGCIGFVGSGASADLGYPPWDELLPREKYTNRKKEEIDATDLQWDDVTLENKSAKLRELLELSREIGKIDATQAIQMAEGIIGKQGRKTIVENYLSRRFFQDGKERQEALLKKKYPEGIISPFPDLLKLPIRRFITTNYDEEIEKELEKKLGPSVWKPQLSFQQTDQASMAIFAVALASANRNMVFHCHGLLKRELERLQLPEPDTTPSALVLTDADYNHWYLSRTTHTYTFQRSMDVILQSNPLFFVGYSISDVDLLRVLRQASLRWESERLASNLFLLLRSEGADDGDIWKRAKQIKLGVNLLTYRSPQPLADALRDCAKTCSDMRSQWLRQPQVKPKDNGPTGIILPRPSAANGERIDPLFTATSPSVEMIAKAFESNRVVALVGSAGSAKFLKACQYVRARQNDYREVRVFHSYNNDDIYSYFKRISRFLQADVTTSEKTMDLRKPRLVVINNIDLLLGDEPNEQWKPPNKRARNFLEKLWTIAANPINPDDPTAVGFGLRVLVTARSLDYPDLETDFSVGGPVKRDARKEMIATIRQEEFFRTKEDASKKEGGDPPRDSEPPWSFTAEELIVDPNDTQRDGVRRLRWELQHENFGLVLATRYVEGANEDNEDNRKERLKRLLETLQANSSEMGTRVVRHIVRDMDALGGREHETLLWFLSFFNTPFTREVFDEVFTCTQKYLFPDSKDVRANVSELRLYRFLLSGLVQEMEPEQNPSIDPSEADNSFIVPPLVKRYFREIMEKTHNSRETREFGLHGLLSKGPFNSPGCSKKPKILFEHLVEVSCERVTERMSSKGSNAGASDDRKIAILLRAVIDVIRSNFSCNSVPLWGEFRDYIDMLSISIDLLRNFAKATGDTWKPGDGPEKEWVCKSPRRAVASADEMLHLYNELGLAYYQTGSVQDALRVWGLADDWRKAVSIDDPEQGEMYNATINAHLGAAYMQLGRMQTARECFDRALVSAKENQDPDLKHRMLGMIARIDHFGGCIKDARVSYRSVIEKLGELKNRRAQCYFMRHLSALEARFGDVDLAARLANRSMAIAASENAPDQVAFSLELKGRVSRAKGDDREAIRQYGIALLEAEKLDIARLKIDVVLGMADIQLRIGDTSAARTSALDALKKANEHLLVMRQAKALIVLGKVAKARSEIALATSLLRHARDLAAESRFRLTEHDAKEALATL